MATGPQDMQIADGNLFTAHTALSDHMPDVVGIVGMCHDQWNSMRATAMATAKFWPQNLGGNISAATANFFGGNVEWPQVAKIYSEYY